jgi:hypothetical protein
MALSGSNKRRSVDQENRIARLYNGQRSPSSGAAVNDAGDVRTVGEVIECKTTGGPAEKPVRIPTFVNQLAKVVEEARERGKTGALALRFYSPDHYLANRDGWVEITVRPTVDDVARTEQIEDANLMIEQIDLKLVDCQKALAEPVG